MMKFQDRHYNIKPESLYHICKSTRTLFYLQHNSSTNESHPTFVKIAINVTYHKEPVAWTVRVYCDLNIFIM